MADHAAAIGTALGLPGHTVRGLRISEGKPAGNAMQTVKDVVIGMLISAPTYWLFTKFLAVNLPGLTGTGWI